MKGRIDMKKRNTFEKLTEIILVLLSVILTAGVKFLFHACGQKEDGSWMHCHDAEQTVFVLGIMLTVMSVLMLIFVALASPILVTVKAWGAGRSVSV